MPCLLGHQALTKQYQRDDNVRALLKSIHDAFDFANHEDTLKSIKPQSKQAEVLALMLRDVCGCSDFIQSYIQDKFCELFYMLCWSTQCRIFSHADAEKHR